MQVIDSLYGEEGYSGIENRKLKRKHGEKYRRLKAHKFIFVNVFIGPLPVNRE